MKIVNDRTSYMKAVSGGFTLVELVLVMVIIGLASALAIPQYVNLSTVAQAESKYTASTSVKSAMLLARADSKTNPDVIKLASYVQGRAVSAVNHGVEVQVKGNIYIVPTYTDINCVEATRTKNDTVKCVGAAL